MAGATPLLKEQIDAIRICTRTMSVLSLLGSCYIISTFICFPIYRKAINRLVFYATWGNIMANIATLISTSGIPEGSFVLTPLCEFQGVLIQWFMMADSLWVCHDYHRAVSLLTEWSGFLHGYERLLSLLVRSQRTGTILPREVVFSVCLWRTRCSSHHIRNNGPSQQHSCHRASNGKLCLFD